MGTGGSVYKDDALILREYYRNYDGTISRESRCLKVVSRSWKGVVGGSEYSLSVKFESRDGEKLYGMGQYQQPHLDHSEASISPPASGS